MRGHWWVRWVHVGTTTVYLSRGMWGNVGARGGGVGKCMGKMTQIKSVWEFKHELDYQYDKETCNLNPDMGDTFHS